MSEEKNKQEEQPIEASADGSLQIAPFMLSILARFKPAQNPLEATHFFSTAEIAQAIKELSPYVTGFTDADVHDAMLSLGYTICSPHGTQALHFKWMLIER